ncbi:MAG: hypothetical protein HFK04_01665 [Oscillospiraceae bacterium]|nr:hypothetical protein [Oscillospiraceae bacterium]
MPSAKDFDSPIESIDQALREIDRLLHQMLFLAELSASGLALDRAALQKVFARLQQRIDRIADRTEGLL